jgi:hypothetical protein
LRGGKKCPKKNTMDQEKKYNGGKKYKCWIQKKYTCWSQKKIIIVGFNKNIIVVKLSET